MQSRIFSLPINAYVLFKFSLRRTRILLCYKLLELQHFWTPESYDLNEDIFLLQQQQHFVSVWGREEVLRDGDGDNDDNDRPIPLNDSIGFVYYWSLSHVVHTSNVTGDLFPAVTAF